MLRKTFSIQPGGRFSMVTAAQQLELTDECARELSSVCDLELRRIDPSTRADIRITFHDDVAMGYSGGKMFNNGDMWLNGQRPIGLGRGGMRVIIHEFCHYFRLRYPGPDTWHSDDPESLMHPNGNKDLDPDTVLKLQAKIRKPASKFYPVDRGLVGNQVNEFARLNAEGRAEITELISERATIRDRTRRLVINAEIQTIIKEIHGFMPDWKKQSQRWHELNNRWKSVPMAHIG